jgi:protein O-GlcNAc transferase
MPLIHRAVALIAFIILFVTILHVLGSRDTVFPSLFSDTAGIPQSQQNLSVSTSTQVETTIPGSEVVTGFALLDRLYLRNGTFFIVTANQSAFPSRRNMISPGLDMGAGHDMEPTDKVRICGDRRAPANL